MIIAKSNETGQMFKKNLSLLSPWLREAVLGLDEKELWSRVQITYNNEGYPVCCYAKDKKQFHITGRQPVKEAELWGKTVSEKGSGVVFLFGSGFGYSLFEIFNTKKPHTIVVLFEQDIYLFAAMLYYFDLEPLISSQKLSILIGDPEYFSQAFDQLFFSIILVSCTYPTIAFSHCAQRNFKSEYTRIYKYVFNTLGLFTFYIGNDHLDTLIGLENLLCNIKDIVINPYISCLKNMYEGYPAFIIANGPSLDKNIHQLNKIGNKGLIICTESTIIPLLKNNIKPDILTVVERTRYTYTYHFENVNYPGDIVLLSLGLIDKNVYPSFPGERIPIFRKSEAINEWINSNLGDGSALDAGANVSHLAFELAVYLGANPVIFVGQDYAYGADGVTHSKDAVYNEEKGKHSKEIILSKPIIYVEGNDGNKIASNQLWIDFRQGLERKIISRPEITSLNATEGGSRIAGTTCITLEAAIDRYCKKPISIRVNDIIALNRKELPVKSRLEGLYKYIESVKSYSNSFHSLVEESIKGKLHCSKMISLSREKGSESNRTIFEEAYFKNINIYQKFLSDNLYRCFTQQVVFAYYYLMNRKGQLDTPEKITEIFQIQYQFFNHLNTICQSICVYLESKVHFLESVLESIESNIKKEDNCEHL